MANTFVIAIAGKKQQGKSTLAKWIQTEVQDAFCDKNQTPLSVASTVTAYAALIKSIAGLIGWDGEKDEKGRGLLINIGKTIRAYDGNLIVDRVLDQAKRFDENRIADVGVVIIDDMRFQCEFDQTKAACEAYGLGFFPILIDNGTVYFSPKTQDRSEDLTWATSSEYADQWAFADFNDWEVDGGEAFRQGVRKHVIEEIAKSCEKV
jgi:hypothetical protein